MALQNDTSSSMGSIDSRYFVASFGDLPYEKLYYLSTDISLPVFVIILAIGITSNILNIFVFVRMGLRDTVTISLLALSISDFAFVVVVSPYVVTLFVNYIVEYRMAVEVAWPFDKRILHNPFYWYSSMFYETSTLVTVYIAVVRTACVAMPLKVKTTFTISRTIITFVIILVGCLLLRLPTFMVHSFVSDFDPSTNRTRIVYRQLEDGGVADAINDIANRNILPWFSFIVVLISVIIMAFKLQESAQFRLSATSKDAATVEDAHQHNKSLTKAESSQKAKNSSSKLSTKEVQIVRSVVLVATVFIACQIPLVVRSLVRRFDPRFNIINGEAEIYPRHFYLYAVSGNVSKFFSYLNASVNIVIYLSVNSRYRQCFKALWLKRS